MLSTWLGESSTCAVAAVLSIPFLLGWVEVQPRSAAVYLHLPVTGVACKGCQPQHSSLCHLGAEAALGASPGCIGIIQQAELTAIGT